MLHIDSRLDQLYHYMVEVIELSSEEMMMVKTAIKNIHEMSPVDKPAIFSRMSNIITASEDLSWVTMIVTRKLNSVKSEIKAIKDPEFTILSRQGRPSTQAIEHEIRFMHSELLDLENKKDVLDNVLGYLEHVEKCLDNYQFLLKDKLKHSESLI